MDADAPKEAEAAEGVTEEAAKSTEEAPANSQAADDQESVQSRCSLTTGPGKTVPGGDEPEEPDARLRGAPF